MSAVLVDTSRSLLENDGVLCHPLIETERLYGIACGAVDIALLA